jgi:perosamine synthetase
MIPVNEPLIREQEIEYVLDALKSGWISSEGKYIEKFEKGMSNYVGTSEGISVNNGTNALVLALRALNLPKGSEVILPSFTIISCALACVYNDLVPVFVDSTEDTFNIDVAKIEEKISSKTKAIMPVHIYGHPVDMDAISMIANKYGLKIIEDFAEAIGSEYKGRKCGSLSHVSCASFYANKVIATGEGGMCLTNDLEIAARLRKLKNLAFVPETRFIHHELGFNFRMTNLQAAIGLAQLERIQEQVDKKIWIGRTYNVLLDNLMRKGVLRLPVEKTWAKSTYWMYAVVLESEYRMNAKMVMAKLFENGIQTRPFFYPMHKQPAFKNFPWFREESLPFCEGLYDRGFYLPSGLTLNEQQLNIVCETVKKVLL